MKLRNNSKFARLVAISAAAGCVLQLGCGNNFLLDFAGLGAIVAGLAQILS